MKSRQN